MKSKPVNIMYTERYICKLYIEKHLMTDTFELYNKLHAKRKNTRIGLYRQIRSIYKVEKALYPGSFVHVTPSLIFPKVVYADFFPHTQEFYSSESLKEYLEKNKEYKESVKFRFHHTNYNAGIPEEFGSFELLISEYAGFVSQVCKNYLKKDGILIVEDSHGDASMANVDKDYELIASYRRKSDEQYTITSEDLREYFMPTSRKITIDRQYIEELARPIRYLTVTDGYIFRKIV